MSLKKIPFAAVAPTPSPIARARVLQKPNPTPRKMPKDSNSQAASAAVDGEAPHLESDADDEAAPTKVARTEAPTPTPTQSTTKSPTSSGAITPYQRAHSHNMKANHIVVDNHELFCRPCGKQLANIADTLKKHVSSQIHLTRLSEYLAQAKKQALLSLSLEKMKQSHVPQQVQLRRFEVLRAFVHCGISLTNFDKGNPLRKVLEDGSTALASRRTMADLLPKVLQLEQEEIVKELRLPHSSAPPVAPRGFFFDTSRTGSANRPVSVIFDGSTTVAEVFAIVLRFVTDDGFIQQRLVSLAHLAHAMDANAISSTLNDILLHPPFQIQLADVHACMADRASVNTAAMNMLAMIYTSAEFLGCLSHTLSNAGKEFEHEGTEHAFLFMSKWINMVARSHRARTLFKAKTGVSAKRANLTRWYFEI